MRDSYRQPRPKIGRYRHSAARRKQRERAAAAAVAHEGVPAEGEGVPEHEHGKYFFKGDVGAKLQTLRGKLFVLHRARSTNTSRCVRCWWEWMTYSATTTTTTTAWIESRGSKRQVKTGTAPPSGHKLNWQFAGELAQESCVPRCTMRLVSMRADTQ